MYEKEEQRAIHLLILSVCTIMILVLTGESLLLGWDQSAIALLLCGLLASWGIHITGKFPESMRLWIYFILSMLAFFFYGIHETSVFDLAPVMIAVIILYSVTENYTTIQFCVGTYFLTMGYDFLFVLGDSVEFSPLLVTRTLLHLLMVYLAGYMVKVDMKRRNRKRKHTEEQIEKLEENNRRTEDFLTNVSHELRTPINAVTGITSVMLKNEDDEDKRKDIFSIQSAGHKLFGQIGDILDFTEIDTGRIRVSEEPYMITSLINDIIVGNRMWEREEALELIFDIDAGIPSVLLGDEKKIKKILEHLIDNAYKFTKEGGIYVRVHALRKEYGINLCIRVSDTGIGMTGEEIEKIREKFYQSNGGSNRRAGGLGLGLPIVYGMVSAMEGFMQIDSTEGKGTTVSVSIPQKVAEKAPAIVLENQENLCIGCYLKPEKYKVPEIRDYYNEMISHVVQGLEISLHRVFHKDELEKLTTVYRLTHLFVGREEYEENRSYFETMDQNIRIIVVAEDGYVPLQGSRVTIMRKPFYSLSIVNILSAGAMEEEALLKEKFMICPGVRVLVVDDEPMNLMVAEGVFKGYQMLVTTADSGRKAIELCEKEEFDLIFLDHMMPEMDGVETLKRLRKIFSDTGNAVMVIAFTANAVSGAREMFLSEGFDEFVSKPIETLEMERILRKVLPKSAILYVDEKDKKIVEKSVSERAGEERSEKERLEKERSEKERFEEERSGKERSGKERSGKETSGEDRLSRLKTAGIHMDTGLQYSGGDKDFYIELLTKFGMDAGKKEAEIRNFFQQEDWHNYTIVVHALKSTAKMVGAETLSELAKEMEMAAKNQDADYIREHQEELLLKYHQVVACIQEVLDLDKTDSESEMPEEGTEISKEQLLEQLEELKEGLDTFEADKAEELISQMRTFVYGGESVYKLLEEVRQDVDDFEFTSAAEKTEALMKMVKGGEEE